MKRRLILLMLTMALAFGTMSGCAEEKKEGIDLDDSIFGETESYEVARFTDKYISVDQKGKYVLHKGDVIYYRNERYYSRGSVRIDVNKMKFDCGEEYLSNATYSLHDGKPGEHMYDEICEDCFGLN